jgi:hypothetical protein
MGYLTTFTIYNDGVDQIEINPEKFVTKLRMGCHGGLTRDNDSQSFGHGYHANLVKVQKPRHADDPTCYVHMGNTVVEINPYSKDTLKIIQDNPEYFENILKYMEQNIKELKKMKKEQK